MKNKKRLTKLQTGYLKVPTRALKLGLSSSALALLLSLLDCAEEFNPTLGLLETRLGLSRPTLTRAFRELREHNVIKLLKTGRGNRPSEYEFIPPAQWRTKRRTDTQSVLRNRLLERGKLVGGKQLLKIRAGCPDGHTVDHIVPIVHDLVCGLNVPWNMQYLSWDEKKLKGNSFDGTYDNRTWKKTKVRRR